MKNIFNKKGRFENCLFITLSIFIIIIGLYLGITNTIQQGISILHPVVFGWPMVVIGVLLLGFEVFYLIKKDERLNLIKKWCGQVNSTLAFMVAEYIISVPSQSITGASVISKENLS